MSVIKEIQKTEAEMAEKIEKIKAEIGSQRKLAQKTAEEKLAQTKNTLEEVRQAKLKATEAKIREEEAKVKEEIIKAKAQIKSQAENKKTVAINLVLKNIQE